jgi:phospholipid N-methyltransferase
VHRKDGTPMSLLDQAKAVANHCHLSQCFPLTDYPRHPPASQYEGSMGLWSALDGNVIDPDQARDIAISAYERGNAHRARWIAHYENRLTYERAMLEEQGAADLLAPKPKPKHPPLVNYRGEGGVIVTENRWRPGETDSLRQVDMTGAEYSYIDSNYKGTAIVEGSHRVRVALVKHERVCVFITDSKTHEKPPAAEPKRSESIFHPVSLPREREPVSEDSKMFEGLRDQLRAGVKVVSAPQLFPTPPELAQRVIAAADIRPGHRVFEPSAGTGALLDAIPQEVDIQAMEINHELASALQQKYPFPVFCEDFLEHTGIDGLGYDRIVMNPPFADGQDIAHVTHALEMLRPGGRLVAIMSSGFTFRQDRAAQAFRELVEERGGAVEELPADAFKMAGTGVRTVLVTIDT